MYVPTYKCACCIFVHLHLEIILSVILVSSQPLTEEEEDTLLLLELEEYEKQGLHGPSYFVTVLSQLVDFFPMQDRLQTRML